MARKPRIEVVGGVYHVTQKGIDDQALFRSDTDRETFLWYLADEVVRSSWRCLAYSLLTTHYHLLIELRELTLSSGCRHLNGRYGQTFNRVHGRRGHVFGGRFHDVPVTSEAHRHEVIRYIHLNAPRANICERPEEHVWCDYASTVGLAPPDLVVDPAAALGLFGDDLRSAQRAYRRFVDEADPRARRGLTRV